jgi:bifunctional DNA-binding transcriptional regulator/antitoxin component of YhaV-PrlF toxin-antitoxin module
MSACLPANVNRRERCRYTALLQTGDDVARTRRGDPVIVRMTDRGTVTIPKELRARAPKSDLLEVVLREDGVYELRPRVMVDASQGWFWSDEWQRREQEADAAFAAGRYQTFDDAESLIADLESAPRDE